MSMSTVWETLYLVRPPPAPSGNQFQPPTSPNDKSPSFNFNKTGVEKVNFSLPFSYVFYEERSQNGCPKVLRIHLLGHETCTEHFLKYVDTVEALEFHGCLEYLESCFKICSIMKKLKDVRFYIGRFQLDRTKSPKRSQSWNSLGFLGSNKISALRIILTDHPLYYKLPKESRIIVNEHIEMIMEYSFKQFQGVQDLRLDLPDSDRFVSLSKDLLRLPKLPKNPRMEITVDYRIYAKIETSNPQAPKRSPSFIMASPDSSEVGPTCSSSVQNKEDGKSEKLVQIEKSQIKAEAHVTSEARPTQSAPTNPVVQNNYSYEMSSVERLLLESAGKIATEPKLTAKRPGDPLVNPNDTKRRPQQQDTNKAVSDEFILEDVTPQTSPEEDSESSPNDKRISKERIGKNNTTSSNRDRSSVERNSQKSQNQHSPDRARRHSNNTDYDHPTQDTGEECFSALFTRRGEIREDRSPEFQHSNRRDRDHTRNTAYRSRGTHPRGNRGRGRGRPGRPYQRHYDPRE